MTPPIPRVWLGLAFFFGVAVSAVLTRTVEGWPSLVPVPDTVPLATQRVLLTLELVVFALAFEAGWWTLKRRRAGRKPNEM
jgi:hypothetical protein